MPVGTIGAMFLTPHKNTTTTRSTSTSTNSATNTPTTPTNNTNISKNNGKGDKMLATPPDSPIKIDFEGIVNKEKEGMVIVKGGGDMLWHRIWNILGWVGLVWYYSY